MRVLVAVDLVQGFLGCVKDEIGRIVATASTLTPASKEGKDVEERRAYSQEPLAHVHHIRDLVAAVVFPLEGRRS